MKKILRLSLCLVLAASSVQAEEEPAPPDLTIPMEDMVVQAKPEGQIANPTPITATVQEPTQDLKDQTSILPPQAQHPTLSFHRKPNIPRL